MKPSWSELATLFQRLEQRLAAARLDYFECEGVFRWTLVSESKDPAPLEFVTLARIAGDKLSAVAEFLNPSIRTERDSCARWYLALRHHSAMHVPGRDANSVIDGEPTGEIVHSGSMTQPTTASAALCLELSRLVRL